MKKYYTDIRVIFADTDAMGIVYHTNYIKWFEVGRTEMMRQAGFPYSELEKKGMWLPVVSVNCEYKAPAFYDDILTVAAWVEKLGGVSVVIGYEITRKETGDLLVTGSTRHGITDKDLKPMKIKREFPEVYDFFSTE